MLNLLQKFEQCLSRMRWKALSSLNKYLKNKVNTEKVKFITKKYLLAIEELTNFEKDMLGIIDNIKFPK